MRLSWEGMMLVLFAAGSILLGSLALLELRGQTIRSSVADCSTVENLLLAGFCSGIGIGLILVTTQKLRERGERGRMEAEEFRPSLIRRGEEKP